MEQIFQQSIQEDKSPTDTNTEILMVVDIEAIIIEAEEDPQVEVPMTIGKNN